jgi:hypothetical protein
LWSPPIILDDPARGATCRGDAALAKHKYCHEVDGLRPAVETYRGASASAASGRVWSWRVTTTIGSSSSRRYERFTDEARALERWNKLVGDRARVAPASIAACRRCPKLLEPGTKSVQAFPSMPTPSSACTC